MVLAGRAHSNPQLTEEPTYLGTLAMVRRGQVGCQKCKFLSLCLLLPLITGASRRLWECGEQAPPWVRGARSQSRCSPSPQPSQRDPPAGHSPLPHCRTHAAGPHLGQGQLAVRYKSPTTSSLLGAVLNNQRAQCPVQGPERQVRASLVHTDTYHSSSCLTDTHTRPTGKALGGRSARRRSSVSGCVSAASGPVTWARPVISAILFHHL